jgi:hypothetical protein
MLKDSLGAHKGLITNWPHHNTTARLGERHRIKAEFYSDICGSYLSCNNFQLHASYAIKESFSLLQQLRRLSQAVIPPMEHVLPLAMSQCNSSCSRSSAVRACCQKRWGRGSVDAATHYGDAACSINVDLGKRR